MNQKSLVPLKAPANHGVGSVRLQRKCACEATGTTCARCASEKKPLRKATNGGFSDFVPPIVNEVLASPGQPLDATTRDFMDKRFGQDFSDVRAHSDSQANASAREVGAVAYASGRHVVFGQGAFRPDERRGSALLAHELAHVVQQRGGDATVGAGADASFEAEADSAAQSFAQGSTQIPIQGRGGLGLARATEMPDDDGVSGWFSSQYRGLEKKIPEKYREAAKQAVIIGADSFVSTMLSPVAPPILTKGSVLTWQKPAMLSQKASRKKQKNTPRQLSVIACLMRWVAPMASSSK